MASSHTSPPRCQWFSRLSAPLDKRSGRRLSVLFFGALLASGLRTITSWIRAADLTKEYRRCYHTVAAAGRHPDEIAGRLLADVVAPLLPADGRVTLALDDTPTERFGPKVQGAGKHHNPTPGPVGSPFLYGHVWVVLGLLMAHPSWGAIALPLLARLYIRRKDLDKVAAADRPPFRTKLELGVELVRWAVGELGRMGRTTVWVVADGAYAKAPFLKEMARLGVTVVSRLRKDAALRSEPPARVPGRRGRPRVYGEQRIVLAKRAGQQRGWTTGTFQLYGEQTTKRYKTFVATWRPVGGPIRVVLVREEKSWRAYFSTDVTATAGDILTRVADRFSLETTFRDVKEVVGAGQQQARRLPVNIGAFHVCLWTFAMTEAWAWKAPGEALTGHRVWSPWDDPSRRPSHADKRRAWQRDLLRMEFQAVLRAGHTDAEKEAALDRLLDLAV